MSGSELNSSSGVIFVVSMHLSIKVLILSSLRFDDEILDFFLPTYVVKPTPKLSDLSDSSNFYS